MIFSVTIFLCSFKISSLINKSISQVRDGVAVPIFLEDFLVPLFRAGQQLQVIMKLLELSNNIGAINGSYEEFLPGCNGFSSKYPSFSSSLTFDKGTIEAIVLARNSFYLQLLEKIDNIFSKFEFRTQGVISIYYREAKSFEYLCIYY